MKGIIIAAGSSTRLRPLTDELPKCLLPIEGKPILHNMIDLFKEKNITDISIIKGYKKEKINIPEVTYFENMDYPNNNILHSLMFARPKLEEALKKGEDVIVTYSDIWFNAGVMKTLLDTPGAIVAVVDIKWEDSYKERTDHTTAEAENVIMDEQSRILKIGKHIITNNTPKNLQGEFIGLWKFTPKGISTFLKHFDRLHNSLQLTTPFQNAKEWQKSYITDIFQELVDKGEEVYCTTIKKNWKEFDTVQDYILAGGTIPEHLKSIILEGKNGKLQKS